MHLYPLCVCILISKGPKQFTLAFTSTENDWSTVETQLPLEWKAAAVWDHTATAPDNLALDISVSCGSHRGEFRETGSNFQTEGERGG